MQQKKRIEAQGPVPGNGTWQKTISTRPDDPRLVSRKQMTELAGVSNPAVITKALERLSMTPVTNGSKSSSTYNNGGRNYHLFEVPYYPESTTEAVRQELERHAQPAGNGRFTYAGVTFRWRAVS